MRSKWVSPIYLTVCALGGFYLIYSVTSPHPQHDVTTETKHTTISTDILILVISTPSNHGNRDILRHQSYIGYKWKSGVKFKHLFIIGQTDNSKLNAGVLAEESIYGDIAIGNFSDSYENLSQKVIWSFRHILSRYRFKFCLKLDEDSFVNLDFLQTYLDSVDEVMLPRFYAGKPRQGSLKIPVTGRFALPDWEDGRISEFAQYNLGGGYIVTRTVIIKILAVAKTRAITPIPWEDVYIGMLAYLAGIHPTRIYHYYVSKFYPFCTDPRAILLHHVSPTLQSQMLHFYDKNGYYCSKNSTEMEILKVYNSNYPPVRWT